VRHVKPKEIKMATSFKKKGSRGRAVYPPGTRPSLHNNQLLTSSGVPSLDNMIGEFIVGGNIVISVTCQVSKIALSTEWGL